jgi:mono/diheme cytochrome c family protein
MNKDEKIAYLEGYQEDKKKGVPFFPDIIFKDVVISLLVFLILVSLAYFLGAPLEERANPADTSYTPRPEWYFLFLFQLLKYFPGQLEVIGVVVLPTLAILLLFALPLLDRSSKRHPANRLGIIGVTSLLAAGVIFLSVQSIRESPPPAETNVGDQTALLYIKNCAACHGPSINVPTGTNLHEVIAQGKHEGMPAWNADLTSNEIDALAGFILSPAGSSLFTQNCSECHTASDLVGMQPLDLKNSIDQGLNFPPHANLNLPDWSVSMTPQERSVLLNFLVAPDGQRLFATDCASCHGTSISFTGDAEELKKIISEGGKHLEMPAWKTKLSNEELDTLANYVVNPSGNAKGEELFTAHCVSCHGNRVPQVADVTKAKELIAGGGSHETMPVWGQILTAEQLDALVNYTMETVKGTSVNLGQNLFAQNCTPCHGELGEGGINPTNKNDIIAPISTSEFLKTRDDITLRLIISQGQPNFGMSPFGTAYGGPLEDDEIDAIVIFLRSWEANPPVEQPPVIASETISLNGKDIYIQICSQCHGINGEGGVGPSLITKNYQSTNTDQNIFDTINLGHKATSMIGWGEILTAEQIKDLVTYIRQLGSQADAAGLNATPTFAKDIQPLFKAQCVICHGSMGGWDASTYDSVMTSGKNAPVIIPGDVEKSLLTQKIQGTQTEGTIMPPGGKMSDSDIQLILDWIKAGAPEK